jgi:hypothetical protein
VFYREAEHFDAVFQRGFAALDAGLDVMGFRRFCEHTVRIAGDSVQGTAYTRPETPAPDFAPHINA